MSTHEVTNQVPPFAGRDLLADDPALVEALERWGGDGATEQLRPLGRLAGSEGAQEHGRLADTHRPVLRTFDSRGNRIDEVEFHPSWHWLLNQAVGAGLTAGAWTEPPASGAHVRRAAGFAVWSRVEAGHGCPVSMTYAAGSALRHHPQQRDRWLPALASRTYEPGIRPVASKMGALAGMGMTEKQGGSDVRANTTRAVATPGGPVEGDTYRLTGHKWFCSAPMSDVFLVLAQAPGGLTCFVVPRALDDGSRNAFALQRLKDKLGNHSNASSEVELDGTWGVRLGDEGRGVRTIIDMVSATRLDCVLGSAATMRDAVARAVHHARHRSAFGALLVDQPLMRNVLADLALEAEAATVLGLRLAHAFDTGESDLARLGVALGKFWVCKRTAPTVAEALECLGGNGYVEENGLARLYREAPLNSIWEGSGNVNALDVLRAVSREPATLEALTKELHRVRGRSSELDGHVDSALAQARSLDPTSAEAAFRARSVVEALALALQASLLVEHSPGPVADAFVASRIAGRRGHTFGSLDVDLATSTGALIERAG
ncbi:putative acyl-CoA dehydrogenase [Humibacillus xanthopallidus]|uniref:Putative acyl-CoA dehydrogenase n=1 Tax=Humibacillus xanthopallidus TaxID=412689 RepID=A0A543PUB2_9MICO|nr:acyl-CoA dehydrogenase family protein [Humibacillus xanthopallidus]TQN47661.1 putative acyl-CoA dehydrogenase [Humibacillus xanthopallidus]